MGYRLSWLAARGLTRAAMLEPFGLRDTGVPDEANEAAFSIAALTTGWTVLWSADEGFATDERAAALSRTAATLAVHVDETCMHSSAALFDAGAEQWRVRHEGDAVIEHLVTTGALPPDAAAVIADLQAQQAAENAGAAEVDFIFDIPLAVAASLCGFKHDVAEVDGAAPDFTVAEPVGRSAGSGLMRRLFGR